MDNPEEEPIMELTINDERIELTRDNTSLFTHIGAAAMFDHVYVVISYDPPRSTYIPSTAGAYPQIVRYMRENHYPRHEDLTDASDADKEVLIEFWTRDLGDLPPNFT